MSFLVAEAINKQYDENIILKKVSFSLEAGAKLAIAGATGSGKTTLLKIIAGLIQPTTGQVLLNNERIKGPDEILLAGHPHIAYLSQHFELRNNYRVVELLQMSSKIAEEEAAIIYRICKIDQLLHRWTNQLSGGERQRISLAMALITSPKLLLLDEPYSNLDAIHKSILKDVLDEVTRQLNITTVIVSHDPVDILSWADSVLVLEKGEIIQQASPQEIYYQPVNEYVAALFGRYNKLTPELAKKLSSPMLLLRPGELQLNEIKNKGISGIVQRISFIGSIYELHVAIEDELLCIWHTTNQFKTGDEVEIYLLKRDYV